MRFGQPGTALVLLAAHAAGCFAPHARGLIARLELTSCIALDSVDFPAETQAAVAAGTLDEQIRRTGARATPARVRVLQLLRATPAPLTHHEIEQALGSPSIDRVTLYRVLDWLAASGLAHKNSDAARVFRFSAASFGEHAAHVHFRCEHCGGVFCLDAPPPVAPCLPAGFTLSRMDFDLRGQCAACADATRATSCSIK